MAAQTQGRVNLLPTDRFEYSNFGRFLRWTLTIGRYLVVVTELVVIIAFLSRFYFDRILTDLRESRIKKEGIVDSFQQVLTDFLETQSRLSAIRNVLSEQYGVNDRLIQIQSLTPSGIEYKAMLVSSRSADLKGFVPNSNTFSAFLGTIQGSPLFDQVSLKSLQLSADRAPGLDFEIDLHQTIKSKEGKTPI